MNVRSGEVASSGEVLLERSSRYCYRVGPSQWDVGTDEVLSRERSRIVKSVVCNKKWTNDEIVQPSRSRYRNVEGWWWVKKSETSTGVPRFMGHKMTDFKLLDWSLSRPAVNEESMEPISFRLSVQRWTRRMVSRAARSWSALWRASSRGPSAESIPSNTRSSGAAGQQ